MATTSTADSSTAKVTVTPKQFTFVQFDADEIAGIARELAEQLGLANPISIMIDEATPLAKVRAEVAGTSSDSPITLWLESGALEDTQRLTTFSRDRAREALGRLLLRAADRMRDDFAGVPDDLSLSLREHAAWDAYCAGRLARLGVAVNQQRWRYNYRNRFGFADTTDRAFDALWIADDLGWAAVVADPE